MFKKAATELLSVQRDDVQSVLLVSVHNHTDDVRQVLSNFPFFNGWREEIIKECCILSCIKRFLPGTVIIDPLGQNYSYSYFIIDGTCNVIQKIVLNIKPGYNGRQAFSVHKNQSITKESQKIKIVFVDICSFTRTNCFGLGEDLTNKWIVSSTAIRCLVVPRDFLLRHNNKNVWCKTRIKLDNAFPTLEEIFEDLLRKVKWTRFKDELTRSVRINKTALTGTKFEDVPRYWRTNTEVPMALVYQRK